MRISTAGPRCIAVRPCDSSLEPSDGEEDSEEEGPLSYRSQTNFMRRFETLMQQQQWPGRDAFRRASPGARMGAVAKAMCATSFER